MARLGYFKGYDAKAVLPWLLEIGDGLGLSRSRRTFFNLQLKIGSAKSLDEILRHLEAAVAYLDISVCALYLTPEHAEMVQQRIKPTECMEDQQP